MCSKFSIVSKVRTLYSFLSLITVTLFTTASVHALPITVNLTIPRVTLIEGRDPFGADELYSRVNINNSGFQESGIIGGVDDGETINPNWSFSSTVDPRGRANYNIPIDLQLWDDDTPQADEQIDVNPTPGRTLSLTYNLQNRQASLPSPQSGNPPGDRATLFFNITSDPFQYLFDVSSVVTLLGPRLFQYEYTLTNFGASTFNIDAWAIPVIGNIDITLQPGERFTTGPIRSTRVPSFANSSILYEDLTRTNFTRQVQVPTPEPASLALFSIGLAGLVLTGYQRKRTT